MKIYYNDDCLTVIWKSLMRDNMWYSMEPAKLKITTTKSMYDDLHSQWVNFECRDSNRFVMDFDIYKPSNEKVKWGLSGPDDTGLWSLQAYVNSISSTSVFPNGTITIVIDISVLDKIKQDKSELRNHILNELV
jgi:hypothetical protein